MAEPERTRPFYPGDNEIPLGDIDWKSRYDELINKKDWDEKRDFIGIKRLGSSYHIIDPFLKFESASYENRLIDRIWYPFWVGTAFTGSYVLASYWSRRPILASILPAIACGALGVAIGLFAYDNSQKRARDRDSVLMHYILLHEHEFPRIERKKFGEIMRPWIPFRTLDYKAQDKD